jgi:hypothetical protein
MSKHNKANKSNYVQGGRLSQDDMARERVNQAQVSGRAKGKENLSGKIRETNAAQEPSRPRSEHEE